MLQYQILIQLNLLSFIYLLLPTNSAFNNMTQILSINDIYIYCKCNVNIRYMYLLRRHTGTLQSLHCGQMAKNTQEKVNRKIKACKIDKLMSA